MIIDRLENIQAYAGLERGFAAAIQYLQATDLDKLPTGRVEIEGDRLFAIVVDGPTRLREGARYESHRRYHDLQIVTHGCEIMGYADVRTMKQVEPFVEENDYAFYDGAGADLLVPAGLFVVFTPRDAHCPSLAVDQPARVRKIVLKVAVESA